MLSYVENSTTSRSCLRGLADALIRCPNGHNVASYPVHDALQGEADGDFGEEQRVADMTLNLADSCPGIQIPIYPSHGLLSCCHLEFPRSDLLLEGAILS